MRSTSTLVSVPYLRLKSAIALALALTAFSPAFAQPAEILPTANPISGLFQLTENSAKTTVTASFSQQYNAVAANVTNTGLQFGGMQNTDGADAKGFAAWTTLNSVSGVSDAMLAEGTSVTGDNAFSIFTASRPLAAAGLSTNGRYLMGQVKLAFNAPVQNPVLQIVGLGATAGALGVTTELELASKGIALSKVSSNANMSVETASILNKSASPDAASASGAASGSILAKGEGITEIVFNVYLRGNGAATDWEVAGQYNGDRWLIGVASATPARMALPVYITDFTVNNESSCAARLRWKMSTELGVTSIAVEHSADGITFNELTKFESDGGAAAKSYAFTAYGAVNGNNYYRLRVENTTAQEPYSKITPLRIACLEENVSVQPNPASDMLTVKGIQSNDRLSLIDVRGMEVKKLVAEGAQAAMNISDLKEGLYMLFVRDARGELMGSVRVQKQ